MPLSSFLFLIAALIFAMTLAYVLVLTTRPGMLEERIGTVPTGTGLTEAEMAQSFGARVLAPLGETISAYVASRTQQTSLETISGRLRLAGLRISPGAFLAIDIISLVLGGVIGVLVFTLFRVSDTPAVVALPVLVAILGYALPRSWLAGRMRARQSRIRNSLPNALDILATCVSAGQAVQAALSKLGQRLNDDLGEELRIVNDQVQLGYPLSEALAQLADRCQIPELTRFTMAVNQAMQMGAPMAEFLSAQADDLRRQRRQRAEERAQTAPLRMLPLMIGCIFPAILIVLLGPGAIAVFHTFNH